MHRFETRYLVQRGWRIPITRWRRNSLGKNYKFLSNPDFPRIPSIRCDPDRTRYSVPVNSWLRTFRMKRKRIDRSEMKSDRLEWNWKKIVNSSNDSVQVKYGEMEVNKCGDQKNISAPSWTRKSWGKKMEEAWQIVIDELDRVYVESRYGYAEVIASTWNTRYSAINNFFSPWAS